MRHHSPSFPILQVTVESQLQPHEYFVQNVVDLQDLLDIRHCVFMMGSSGNNKSEAWKTLAKVMESIRREMGSS